MLCLQSHRLCCAVQKIWFQYFQNNSKYWHQHPICGSVPIASPVLYIKHHLRLQTEITDRWEIQKMDFEKGETYFLTSCISTPFLAHDIQASESSREKRIATAKKWKHASFCLANFNLSNMFSAIHLFTWKWKFYKQKMIICFLYQLNGRKMFYIKLYSNIFYERKQFLVSCCCCW